MKSIVIVAENTAPRFNDVVIEYADSRGFVMDAARVRTPTDKPRVERVVQYTQKNFFVGETFFSETISGAAAFLVAGTSHLGRHSVTRAL